MAARKPKGTKKRRQKAAGQPGAAGGTRSVIGKARRHLVVELRTLGRSVTEIAAELGVTTGVVSRTLQLPEIVAAIEAAHAESLRLVIAKKASLQAEVLDRTAAIARGRGVEVHGGEEIPVPVVVETQLKALRDLATEIGLTAPTKVEAKHEHTGPGGGPVQHQVSYADLSDDELRAIVEKNTITQESP